MLIISYSFVHWLARDLVWGCIEQCIKRFDEREAAVHMHRMSGRTFSKLVKYDLIQVFKLKLDIVILEVSSNNLTKMQLETLGSENEELACTLHEHYRLKVIAVSTCLHSQNQVADYNHKVDVLNQYLQVVLEQLAFAIFFWYTGLQISSGVVLK